VLHHGWRRFQRLRRGLLADPGCEVVPGAQVWAIEESATSAPTVHVLRGEQDGSGRTPAAFTPDAVVLATGAHDRTLPFPGWDLPGVFTAGAAQALAKGERLAVGRRVLVAGAGPFLLPVAASLVQTGATVVGVLEANGWGRLARGWLRRPWELAPTGGKVVELAGYARHHLRSRIPYRTGAGVVAAHGTDRVESVTVADLDATWAPVPGTQRTVAVDAVCVSHGFVPRLELALAAGAEVGPAGVVVDGEQRTTAPGVFAAGEVTGIGGMDLAAAEGAIAGHCAAGGRADDPGLRPLLRRRTAMSRFATRLEAAHGIRPGWVGWLDDATLICRCEEVPYGQLRRTASATGSCGLRSLKLSTRAGLGICQGRICGRTVEELLARATPGNALLDSTTTDRRPLAVPVRLGELAADPAGPPAPTS
jgi:NADPH-dependent 2,4-dienoyl-CoA reductase/sulfur reductase-like enzyme